MPRAHAGMTVINVSRFQNQITLDQENGRKYSYLFMQKSVPKLIECKVRNRVCVQTSFSILSEQFPSFVLICGITEQASRSAACGQ